MTNQISIDSETIAESNQIPKTKKRKRNRRKKRFCGICGQPKHYVCHTHHNLKKKGIDRIYRVVRRYSRKAYFAFLVSIGLAENK